MNAKTSINKERKKHCDKTAIQQTWLRRLLTVGTLGIVYLTPLHLIPALGFQEDKNWPCVQAKVKQLNPGQMWRGKPFNYSNSDWQSNAEAKTLALAILPRRIPLEKTGEEISAFAKKHNDDLQPQLQHTFLALLDETNRIRTEILGGIERFAKRQKALVVRITDNRHKLNQLEEKDQNGTLTKEEDKEMARLEQALEWDQRIHEEREQSLEYVCEAPVILEQRLFALSKQIIAQLEN